MTHTIRPVPTPAQPAHAPASGVGHGFTLVEMLVAMAIIVVVLGITVAVIARARSAAESVTCLSNLRQIHQGFVLYAERYSGRLPDPYVLNTSWEGCLRSFVDAHGVFRCKADEEIAPVVGSSYDWRDTPDANTTLAGRSLLDVRRQDAVMVFESLPGWHAKRKMNAVRVDGAAVTLDQRECLRDLEKPLR